MPEADTTIAFDDEPVLQIFPVALLEVKVVDWPAQIFNPVFVIVGVKGLGIIVTEKLALELQLPALRVTL